MGVSDGHGCLFSASSSLGRHLITDSTCPTWVEDSQTKLPTARSHYALDTGAHAAWMGTAPIALHADWMSLSVSHCGGYDLSSQQSNSTLTNCFDSSNTYTMRLSPVTSTSKLFIR
jgi:hypothetical protein